MNDHARLMRFAVLIDAENSSPQIAEGLFDEVAEIGEASVRRIYGDFSEGRLKGWAQKMPQHAMIAQQQFAHTSGKNACDIALVIDAMDLLHRGQLDGFCLVSSDSDFTRLASRLREEGMLVIGFGEQKTPSSYRQACNRFINTENLVPKPISTPQPNVSQPALPQPAGKKPPSAAIPMLRKALKGMEPDTDGWHPLGIVGQRLNNLYPDFDSRTFGSAKLSDLAKRTGKFETSRTQGAGTRIRERV